MLPMALVRVKQDERPNKMGFYNPMEKEIP